MRRLRVVSATALLGSLVFWALGAMAEDVDASTLALLKSAIQARDYAQALQQAKALLRTHPRHTESRFLKGVALTELGRSDEAIEVFQALTRDEPRLPEPYNNLAVIYAGRGEYDSARDALLKALRTHSSYAVAHENLGDVYARLASEAYRQALSVNTSNRSAKTKLTLIEALFSDETQSSQAQGGKDPPLGTRAVAATEVPDLPLAVGINVDDIHNTVLAWARAWSDQDPERYLGFYAEAFEAQSGLSRQRWAGVRRIRLTRPKFVEVDVSDIQVVPINEDQAEVTFLQDYRSSTFADAVRKILILGRVEDEWKILRERLVR